MNVQSGSRQILLHGMVLVLVGLGWAIHTGQFEAVEQEGERILRALLPELPLKTAVRLAAELSGESRNALYERALALKQASGDEGEAQA